MGKTLRVGCAQYTAQNGDIGANLATITQLAATAAKDGVELLVLPELAVSGYVRPELVPGLAQPIPGSISQAMAALARDHNLAVAFGIAVREAGGQLRNTMLLLDSDGQELLRYHKVHLWDNEKSWATPGDHFSVAKFGDLTLGQWICYDNRFPEAARSLAKSGAQLGLVCAAWLGPAEEWELSLRSRAMDNGIFVAGSVHLGPSFHGVAMIADPHGNIITRGEVGQNQIVSADIDPDAIARFHQRIPLLQHLRPDSYK
jgi:5-aminopentanamidase|uniref:carbon-nitrogen hydrolase family protein n=1 Tax=Cephaloticoccus sp. TaxID=1985742 RepID=UPI00404A3F64